MKSIRRILLLCCFLTVGVCLFAQTNFEELSLPEAIEKAKEKGKMVFVDCYTSWCGPCKYMADKIFTQKEMGEYLNSRFVCVKYDMERGDGPDIAVKYNVAAYPTFLICWEFIRLDTAPGYNSVSVSLSNERYRGKERFAKPGASQSSGIMAYIATYPSASSVIISTWRL